MTSAADLNHHPVVLRLDVARAHLHQAGDVVLTDLRERAGSLGSDQLEAAYEVLGAVIEHADCIELARVGVIGSVTSPDDPEVGLLITRAGVISSRILAAA